MKRILALVLCFSYNEIVTRFSADVMKDDGKALEGIWSLATDVPYLPAVMPRQLSRKNMT